MTSNTREVLLDKWLQSELKTINYQKAPLAGDASFRRYYRVWGAGFKYVVMDAPPPEVPEMFVNIGLILEKQNVLVPKVIAKDLTQGFLLLSDLGDRLYLKELNSETADKLYSEAFQAMLNFQKSQAILPTFDRPFLRRQSEIFEEWYLKKHRGVILTEALQLKLKPVYEKIVEVIECQPEVFVHRDYHSRNLMINEAGKPGVLDFQDAMKGPITYDLVSLLQDCYISWPRDRVVGWVEHFRVLANQAGLLTQEISAAEFLKWFDWTGIQRHLKNLGIFSRLHYRDNKSTYLKDIPQLLSYLSAAIERYDELKPLEFIFESLTEEVAQ